MTDLQHKIVNLRSKGYGYKKIAKELKISKNTVASFCRRNNLSGFTTGSFCICKYCGTKTDYIGSGRKPEFCSDECKKKWRKFSNE